MKKVNLTQEEINQIKDVIYNEIDNKGGIENINEERSFFFYNTSHIQ